MASPTFNKDGSLIGFLKTVKGISTLAVADTASGHVRIISMPDGGDTDANLSLEEKLRRERTRQVAQGVTSIAWIPDTSKVIFPRVGSLLCVDASVPEGSSVHSEHDSTAPTLHTITAQPSLLFDKTSTGAEGSAIDPKLSPDGSMLAFVQQDELYVLRLPAAGAGAGAGTAVRVTYGARDTADKGGLHNGLADYVTDEEFDRHTGYWWSPCGRYIAFQHTDERHIPRFTIPHGEQPAAPHAGESHRYPFAGAANPIVKIGVLEVAAALANAGASSPVVWLDVGGDTDLYIPRVAWLPTGLQLPIGGQQGDRPQLALQVMNRRQNVLDLVVFDSSTGKGCLLVRDTPPAHVPSGRGLGKTWVNTYQHCTFLDPVAWPKAKLPGLSPSAVQDIAGYVLWGSERSGYEQVYLYALSLLPEAYGPAPSTEGGGSGKKGKGKGAGSVASRAYSGPPKDAAPYPPGTEGPGEGTPLPATCLGCVTGRSSSKYVVEDVAGVFPIPGGAQCGPALYFTGSLDSPLERHLYAVPIFRSEWDVEERVCHYGTPGLRRLTSGPGMHTCVLAGREGAVLIADTLSSLHCPPSLSLLRYDPSQRFPSHSLSASHRPASLGGTVKSPGPASSSRPMSLAMSPGPTTGAPFLGAGPLAMSAGAGQPDPLGASRGRSMSISSGAQGTDSDVLLAPFTAPAEDITQVVAFERTGWYGARMSVGVALIAVLAGAVPTGLLGTPGHYTALRAFLQAKAAGREEGGEGGADSEGEGGGGSMGGASAALSTVTRALEGVAAVVSTSISSGMTRLDGLGERVMNQLQQGVSIPKAGNATTGSSSAPAGGTASATGNASSGRPPSGSASGLSGLGIGAALGSLPGLGLPTMPTLDGIGRHIKSALKPPSPVHVRAAGETGAGDSALHSSSSASSGEVVIALDASEQGSGREGAGGQGGGAGARMETPVKAGEGRSGRTTPVSPGVVNMNAALFGLGTPAPTGSSPPSGLGSTLPSSSLSLSSSSLPSRMMQGTWSSGGGQGGGDPALPSSYTAATPEEAETAATAAKANPAPLIFRLPSADGVTPLFACLHLPDPTLHGHGPYPLILSVYGGPRVQKVKAEWNLASEARAQALRRDGFMVLSVDNRGTARRGLAFEAHLHRAMGTVEVEDQAHAVKTVLAFGKGMLGDSARVGVYGWSYGGYMTLQCMMSHPGLFHMGVAGAPVVYWEGYDTGYTERYMDTPAKEDNAAGYGSASVLSKVDALCGRLLLVHGLLDENVHVRHTWALVRALQQAGIPHETLFLPGERHVVRNPSAKAYMDSAIKDHFHRYMGSTLAAPEPVTRVQGSAVQAQATLPLAAASSSAEASVVDTPTAPTPSST